MKYAVITFGCRVNQADSLAVEGQLRASGGEAVPADAADLVIVNTCSVTAGADQGARQTIRRVARLNPARDWSAAMRRSVGCGNSEPPIAAVHTSCVKTMRSSMVRTSGSGPSKSWMTNPGRTARSSASSGRPAACSSNRAVCQ